MYEMRDGHIGCGFGGAYDFLNTNVGLKVTLQQRIIIKGHFCICFDILLFFVKKRADLFVFLNVATPQKIMPAVRNTRALYFFFGGRIVWHYIGVEYEKTGRTLLRRVSRGREMWGDEFFLEFFHQNVKFFFTIFVIQSHTQERDGFW